jgi:hypothetical protein
LESGTEAMESQGNKSKHGIRSFGFASLFKKIVSEIA